MLQLLETALSLGLLCGSSVAGFWLRRVLSDRHFNRDTLDSMRLVISMLVTFSALVLGLLTASVKGRFDNQSDVMRGYAVQLIEMNQRLREYGPDAEPARILLRAYTADGRIHPASRMHDGGDPERLVFAAGGFGAVALSVFPQLAEHFGRKRPSRESWSEIFAFTTWASELPAASSTALMLPRM